MLKHTFKMTQLPIARAGATLTRLHHIGKFQGEILYIMNNTKKLKNW